MMPIAPEKVTIGGVYFQPWIGKNYWSQERRILLLGESHYGEPDQRPSLTRDLTQGYVGGWNHRFWTGLMRMVEGPDKPIDRKIFWEKVAFYNYVQAIVGEKAGIAPEPRHFEESAAAFYSVLNYLKPTHVLVVEKRLRLHMPEKIFSQRRSVILGGMPREVSVIGYGEGQALASWTNHPSRSSPKKWHPVVADFLGMTETAENN